MSKTPVINDFKEPPVPWDNRTVTFDSEETWEAFGNVIAYKREAVHKMMNDPETPEGVYESNTVNLEALEQMLNQYKLLDEEVSKLPIEFQFNEPIELMQALFACQLSQQVMKKHPDEQSGDVDEKLEAIATVTAMLADVHWNDDILELITEMEYT